MKPGIRSSPTGAAWLLCRSSESRVTTEGSFWTGFRAYCKIKGIFTRTVIFVLLCIAKCCTTRLELIPTVWSATLLDTERHKKSLYV
jgi:hypothetical protein